MFHQPFRGPFKAVMDNVQILCDAWFLAPVSRFFPSAIFQALIRCGVRQQSGTLGAVGVYRRPVRPQWHPPPSTGTSAKLCDVIRRESCWGHPHLCDERFGRGWCGDWRHHCPFCRMRGYHTSARTTFAGRKIRDDVRGHFRRHVVGQHLPDAVTEVEETFNLTVSVALGDVTATPADDRRCRHLRNCSKRCSFVNVHNVVHESLKNRRDPKWRHRFVLL